MQLDAEQDLILVGPARSGTTLACALLNTPEVANTVALDEPYERTAIAATRPEQFLAFVTEEFRRHRRMLLEDGKTMCTTGVHGLDNHYDSSVLATGLRERVVTSGMIRPDKQLAQNFRLVVKHTIPFTAMLDDLRARYPICAIIRNPVAVLGSWNTINASYRDGLPPSYAAHLCGDMPWLIKAVRDRVERQVVLLSWHLERYLPLLREGRVIRYEDVIESQGRVLAIVSAGAGRLSADLENQNLVRRLPAETIEHIRMSLHRLGGPIWDFYDRRDTDRLTSELCIAAQMRS